jgi:predicted RNA-binding Zn-ribbon protein involved in translation (DUF1610 family)
MSTRPWRCRSCGEELGVTERASLYPKPYAPIRADADGTVAVTCPSCAKVRLWKPRTRYTDADPTPVVGLLVGT